MSALLQGWGEVAWGAIGLALVPLVLAAWVQLGDARGWFERWETPRDEPDDRRAD